MFDPYNAYQSICMDSFLLQFKSCLILSFLALSVQSKKISNDQELIQSDPALKTKREITKYIN